MVIGASPHMHSGQSIKDSTVYSLWEHAFWAHFWRWDKRHNVWHIYALDLDASSQWVSSEKKVYSWIIWKTKQIILIVIGTKLTTSTTVGHTHVYVIILMSMYTQRVWAHRQRQHNIFHLEKLIFLCSWWDLNSGHGRRSTSWATVPPHFMARQSQWFQPCGALSMI